MTIDKDARIHDSAKIAEGVEIGPWTVIEENAVIGAGTKIGAHVVIARNTQLGENNIVHPYACIGGAPQTLGDEGLDCSLQVGSGNTFREYTTIHRGSVKADGITRIGDNNYFMTYVHVGHDCVIGNEITVINNAALAGHIQVDDHAYIGAGVVIHQFCNISAYSFVTRYAKIGKDVMPYTMTCGGPDFHAKTFGINKVGLERKGFDKKTIRQLDQAYRTIFRRGHSPDEALAILQDMLAGTPEIQLYIDAIHRAQAGRGIER